MEENLIQITVDKQKALQYGLSLTQIKEQINEKFLAFPAGNVQTETLQIPIRVQQKIETIKQLENLPLSSPIMNASQGAPASAQQAPAMITLKDVATIQPVTDQGEITRYNLQPSLSMAITKKQDANTVEVADKVINVLDKYKDKIDYAIGFDSAEGIKKSVETLVREGLLGALFASIAVLVFLRNVRATIIAIVSIPLSLLVASIFLQRMDISLNIMTLGGMAVAVGRVVDDSIVVIENIFRRVRKSNTGMTDELVEDSTKEILKAITSSTITTVVVFLPLGLVGGVTGEFFLPFALTIVFSLLMSLVVAITIVPILAKFSFKKVPPEEKEGALQRAYGKAIEWALNHKQTVLLSSILLLIGSFAIVPKLGFTFIPNEEQKTLIAAIELPSSTTLEKTNDVSLKMEKMFDEKKEIKEVTAGIGTRDFRSGLKRKNQANYFITLEENVNVSRFIKELEKEMENIAQEEVNGAKVGVQELQSGESPSNNDVNIDLYSTNLTALQQAAKDVEAYLKKRNDLKYVTNNFADQQKQVIVDIDPQKAAHYGVSGFQVLGTIADQTYLFKSVR